MKRQWFLALFLLLGLALVNVAGAAALTGYSLDWWSVDGGGADSVGGPYSLDGSIGQPDAGTVPLAGGTYTLTGGFWSAGADLEPPEVVSILRADPSPTNAASVDFTVTFSKPVSGVDATDFLLTVSNLTGSFISTVSGGPTVYNITANSGTGNGTLRLDLIDDDSITDSSGNPLGGNGVGNGNHSGDESYFISNAPPHTDILTHPDNPTSIPNANFTFSSTDTIATFMCALDSAPFADCASPANYTGLANGPHTFEVRASDALGNAEDPPASFPWTIHPGTLTLTINKDGTGTGTVVSLSPEDIDCGSSCVGQFLYGQQVILEAQSDGDSLCTGWDDSSCTPNEGTAGTCTVTMNEDHTITFTFTHKPSPIYIPLVVR